MEEVGNGFIFYLSISPSDRWKIEVVNRSLGDLLQSLVVEHHSQWDKIMP
jgi:hypothetical protein